MKQSKGYEELRLMFIMELIAQLSPAEQDKVIALIGEILSER